MEATRTEIYSSLGKPLNPKYRSLFIFVVFFILVIVLIGFLIFTGYIKISDPVNG
jgi:hypothetical protein